MCTDRGLAFGAEACCMDVLYLAFWDCSEATACLTEPTGRHLPPGGTGGFPGTSAALFAALSRFIGLSPTGL